MKPYFFTPIWVNQGMQDLRAELAQMVDEAEINWLLPHAQRGALVAVDPALDLIEVGLAIANDNVPSVHTWIQHRQLVKLAPDQLLDRGEPTQRFHALIVQPYVLMQDLPAT